MPQKTNRLSQKIFQGISYAFSELLGDIAKPFMVGVLIAGVITFFFPADISNWSSTHPFYAMLLMLGAGIPMYVCATSSTPIAAALILKGLNPGAALVFLIAGPATNTATMNIIRKIFSPRALFVYLLMIGICALGMGMLLDYIYQALNIQAAAVVGQAQQLFPQPAKLAAAAVLTFLIFLNFYNQIHQNAAA